MRKRVQLTAAAIERFTPPKDGRDEYADTLVPGLTLRINSDGRSSFSLLYRVRGEGGLTDAGLPKKGALHRMKLLAPDLKGVRAEARAALEQADLGNDPGRARARKVVEAREVAANTFGAASELFLKEHREQKNKPATYADAKSVHERLILPHWRDKPLSEIKRIDITRLLAEIARDRKVRPHARNRVLKEIKGVLGWAVDQGLLENNVAQGYKQPVKEPVRERVLIRRVEQRQPDGRTKLVPDAGELLRVWRATETLRPDEKAPGRWQRMDPPDYPFGPLHRLLILLGQRRDEVGEMRWRDLHDLDGDAPRWVIPGSETKSGRMHVVPLPPQAVTILEGLPRFRGPYVFSTTAGERPVSGHSKAKNRLDTAIASDGGADMKPWRVHDLRRTCATGMSLLHVAPHIVAAVLNHSLRAVLGVTKVYDQNDWLPEKRDALAVWANYVEQITSPSAATNVVELVR